MHCALPACPTPSAHASLCPHAPGSPRAGSGARVRPLTLTHLLCPGRVYHVPASLGLAATGCPRGLGRGTRLQWRAGSAAASPLPRPGPTAAVTPLGQRAEPPEEPGPTAKLWSLKGAQSPAMSLAWGQASGWAPKGSNAAPRRSPPPPPPAPPPLRKQRPKDPGRSPPLCLGPQPPSSLAWGPRCGSAQDPVITSVMCLRLPPPHRQPAASEAAHLGRLRLRAARPHRTITAETGQQPGGCWAPRKSPRGH